MLLLQKYQIQIWKTFQLIQFDGLIKNNKKKKLTLLGSS